MHLGLFNYKLIYSDVYYKELNVCHILLKDWIRKRPATSRFRSFDILNPRISLFVGSIAIQSQMNSKLILFTVSSTQFRVTHLTQ
ncbi:MAG TPA: hypothetical protein VFY41_01210, partial [Nitrososphaeraceae archaeon]|nr:hypothetical protein [Nitrososphaeraceae archaeon]